MTKWRFRFLSWELWELVRLSLMSTLSTFLSWLISSPLLDLPWTSRNKVCEIDSIFDHPSLFFFLKNPSLIRINRVIQMISRIDSISRLLRLCESTQSILIRSSSDMSSLLRMDFSFLWFQLSWISCLSVFSQVSRSLLSCEISDVLFYTCSRPVHFHVSSNIPEWLFIALLPPWSSTFRRTSGFRVAPWFWEAWKSVILKPWSSFLFGLSNSWEVKVSIITNKVICSNRLRWSSNHLCQHSWIWTLFLDHLPSRSWPLSSSHFCWRSLLCLFIIINESSFDFIPSWLHISSQSLMIRNILFFIRIISFHCLSLIPKESLQLIFPHWFSPTCSRLPRSVRLVPPGSNRTWLSARSFTYMLQEAPWDFRCI